MRQIVFVIFFFVLVAASIATALFEKIGVHRAIEVQETVERPPAESIPVNEPASSPSGDTPITEEEPPTNVAAINWDVPFTSQAPGGEWVEPYKEACEEASALMAVRFFLGGHFSSVQEADDLIVRYATANKETLGYAVDQTVAQVAELIALQAPELETEILENPTQDTIMEALRDGGIIVMPAAGRQLGNPYFQNPGPYYHMLVLRGFTDDGYVITNDPGTRNGEAFVYSWETILSSNHDWNPGGDIENGARRMLIVKK